MSLLPFILDLDDDFIRPSHLLDQHFGLGLGPQELEFLSGLQRRPQGRYYRPWRTGTNALARPDAGSAVIADEDKFQVCLDVQQFSPKEIAVKTVDNFVVVEGKHEEKQDEHGYISRQFVRRYALPDGHDPKEVVSNLSSDGVLTVTAPRRAAALPASERIVPITVTGPVHRSLENKEAGSGDKGKDKSA